MKKEKLLPYRIDYLKIGLSEENYCKFVSWYCLRKGIKEEDLMLTCHAPKEILEHVLYKKQVENQIILSWFQSDEKRKSYLDLRYFYVTTFVLFNLLKKDDEFTGYPGFVPNCFYSKKNFKNLLEETFCFFVKEGWVTSYELLCENVKLILPSKKELIINFVKEDKYLLNWCN
jgi:hypothetical protein